MIPQVRMNHQAWRGSFGKWDLNATELSHSLAVEYSLQILMAAIFLKEEHC